MINFKKIPPEKIINLLVYTAIITFGLFLAIVAFKKVIFCDETSFQSNIVHFITEKTIVPIYINYPSFLVIFLRFQRHFFIGYHF